MYDQLQRPLPPLPQPPKRIVSLVPSQTELLHYLGLDPEIQGITKFCIHPQAWQTSKMRIGGTKNPQLERIAALQPDFILANKEENNRSDIEWLAERFPVYVSDINTLAQAYEFIADMGKILKRQNQAQNLIQQLQLGFQQLLKPQEKPRVAYLIWQNPLIAVGSQTFIHHLLDTLNWYNVFETSSRYPQIDWPDLQAAQPDFILLSSEPYPFEEKHRAIFQEKLPHTQILLVDGEYFSWYGSRLLPALDYFQILQKQMLNSI